ncbi:hypothetical protein [Hyphomicrobium sp. NDB2Meth4]|uniref:hypothetical protein n=1 Tax=Hyphomicrobium sp. NDB2Meth4 TaxID=1892846 RepID=UPI000931E890|nr:hypothetical protein [Hyphomicrobium sp. NDB2Meth4]
MPPKFRTSSPILPLLAAGLSLALTGCGTDDIQFNGGIFDAVGLSDGTKVKGGDPKLAERAPLVVPPTLDNLPAPGQAPAPTEIAGINDPDAAKQKSKAELEAAQKAYCDKNYRDAGMRGEETSMVEGPLGPCRPSILTSVKKWNQGDDAEGQ